MGLLWSAPHPPTPQAKAGPSSYSRGMVPACWLGTDAGGPHFYSSPTCPFTQHPFIPPALASQPQGPKPLTQLFLPSWFEQVTVTQGLQACQLLTSLPPWPLLVGLCVWPANREARSCSLVLGAVASNISNVFWPQLTFSKSLREGRRACLPDHPAFLACICHRLCCNNLEGSVLSETQGASLCS